MRLKKTKPLTDLDAIAFGAMMHEFIEQGIISIPMNATLAKLMFPIIGDRPGGLPVAEALLRLARTALKKPAKRARSKAARKA